MLDLELTLTPDLTLLTLGITHTIYLKERNIYQYIPNMSEHSPHIFKNFVLQELQRYRLACTSDQEYDKICSSFSQRLQARGYQPDICSVALQKVPPRTFLMELLYLQIFLYSIQNRMKKETPY